MSQTQVIIAIDPSQRSSGVAVLFTDGTGLELSTLRLALGRVADIINDTTQRTSP